jgi:hypothetical protein
MTERVVKPRGRKKKEDSSAASSTRGDESEQASTAHDLPYADSEGAKKLPSLAMATTNSIPSIQRRQTEEVEKAITAIRYHQKLPTFHQPSGTVPEALDTAYFAHFTKVINVTKAYAPEVQWLAQLPCIQSRPQKPSVKYSLRAISMACYGKLHHDPSILVDSWRWYTLSLSAQRMSMSQHMKTGMPEEDEVLVPLILAMYDMYLGPTTVGSLSHLAAASEILNMRGPSNSRGDAMWPLFTAVRNSEVA